MRKAYRPRHNPCLAPYEPQNRTDPWQSGREYKVSNIE